MRAVLGQLKEPVAGALVWASKVQPSASRRLQGGAEAATEDRSGVLWVPPCPGDWVPHVGPPVGPTSADDSGTCGSLGAWGSPRGFVTCPRTSFPQGSFCEGPPEKQRL